MRFFEGMNKPRVNRVIGYVILFLGFLFIIMGTVCRDRGDGIFSIVCYVFGGLLDVFSVVWMVLKVRCPHCGAILHFKLYDIRRCPYCGRSTDPDDC